MNYDSYKLVRDKIPEIMQRSGSDRTCERVLDETSYKQLLRKKLYEEIAELTIALSNGVQREIEDELADVYEVLIALGDKYRCRDVIEVAQEKLARRGGFYQGYILKVDNEDS